MPDDYPTGTEMPATIGSEIRELEQLATKLSAVLSPVLSPRLVASSPETASKAPVQPSYLQRLRSVRQDIQSLLGSLEL